MTIEQTVWVGVLTLICLFVIIVVIAYCVFNFTSICKVIGELILAILVIGAIGSIVIGVTYGIGRLTLMIFDTVIG